MRATLFGSLVVFAMLQGQGCFAQSAPDDKPTPSAEAPGRAGSLSPDEARRAARARARKSAAAAAKAGPRSTASTLPAPAPAAEKSAAAPQPAPTHTAAAPSPVDRTQHAEKRQASVAPVQHRRTQQRARFAVRDRGPMVYEPRIGERVPAYVPLYPMPRRYGPGPVVGGYWRYPPYPRYRYGPPPFPVAGE
jgi:hypothetical protein